MKQAISLQTPLAKKNPEKLITHNDTRIDNYFWLNDREDPEVIAYLNAENAYREEMMEHTLPLQDKIYKEIIGRIKQKDESVPFKDNGYLYYIRYEEGKEYPLYCRRKDEIHASEEILLNVNDLAKEHDYYHVGSYEISPNNLLMAFTVDTVSRRQYQVLFKNLQTGEIIDEDIKNASGSGLAWADDNKTLFYTQKDPVTLREDKIIRHILGSPEKSITVFTEEDDTFYTTVHRSKTKKYILIASTSTVSSEYRFLKSDEPEGVFTLFSKRERDLEYSVIPAEDTFFILTNWEAKNFRLMETSFDATDKNFWKEVVPGHKDIFLEGMELFENYLVLQERKEGLTRMRIINRENKDFHFLDFGEETYAAGFSDNYEIKTNLLRYSYSSLTTPHSVIEYNLETKEKNILKEQEVVGGYDKNKYETKRLWAKASDETLIPLSIVYKKGIPMNGTNPCLLYGYGSYGYSMDDVFSSVRLSLLDRGFIFAIAHIRGGQEMGRHWYEDGKLLKKKNTFTDFIACAEHLIHQKYTSKENLFAMGGSAGGLLMGAILNMRPDLWKGVIAAVPFVDVVTTMLDESIPLTTGEFDEWGNPKEKKYYEYIKSYSPYDNVESQKYPAILVTTGLHDSQVQYFEPAKWVAKLRELKQGNTPLYLYCNMDTGHGGASGRFEKYKETAMEYAFLLDLVTKY